MTRHSRAGTGFAIAAIALLAAVRPISAQLIPVKTIPIAESEQFAFFPSAGRTNLSMVLPDSLLDPFTNPAKAALLSRSQYFGAPSFFSVSGNAGGGTTFPLGALFKRGSTFAGIAAAFQQIDRQQSTNFGFFGPGSFDVAPGGFQSFEDEPSSQSNRYAFAILGHALDSGRTSVAVSALWSGLNSLDGVDQFYNGNQNLRQLGDAVDMRLGFTRALGGGRALEAVVLRNRFGMSHEVNFLDPYWDPASRQTRMRQRNESNGERSSVWGVHLEYEHPLDSGWRVGALATSNLISHPRIPTYEITAGLGNRGRATAFNFGGGIGRSLKDLAFGLDAIFEPIASRSWVPDTLENQFSFRNMKLRGGVSRDFALLMPGSYVRLQAGAEYHWINYTLRQDDLLNDVRKSQKEHWLERGRSGGISFLTSGLQLHYLVTAKTGVGRPGVVGSSGIGAGIEVLSVAPWMVNVAPATLGSVNVTRHQFSVSVPVR